MIIECYLGEKLMVTHTASSELTTEEILERYGLSAAYTVVTYPNGRPDKMHVIQQGELTEGYR